MPMGGERDNGAIHDPRNAQSAGNGPPCEADLLAIETRNVHKAFGSQQVLAGCDLKIPEGAISVVLGPSGTGKSVLLKQITGMMTPDKGEVLVRGQKLSALSRSGLLSMRRDIGVMFQDGALFSSMTVAENVAFPLRQHTDLGDDDVRDLVAEHLQSVGLDGAKDQYPASLSGGMRKRVGLARSLVLEPRVLLCDEPDSGLDPVRTALLGSLLIERHEELGGTILIVTHNVPLARLVAEHISVLWQGKVLEAGPRSQLFASGDEFVQQFLNGEPEGPLGMGQ